MQATSERAIEGERTKESECRVPQREMRMPSFILALACLEAFVCDAVPRLLLERDGAVEAEVQGVVRWRTRRTDGRALDGRGMAGVRCARSRARREAQKGKSPKPPRPKHAGGRQGRRLRGRPRRAARASELHIFVLSEVPPLHPELPGCCVVVHRLGDDAQLHLDALGVRAAEACGGLGGVGVGACGR